MPSYLTPGVYVEEVTSQSKPIEGVGTSVAAFVGLAPGGPVNRPMRISNWTQFAKLYGDPNEPENGPFMPGAYLAHSVYGYFQNGGGVCWIVRVGAGDGDQKAQAALPAASGEAELLRATAREGVTDQVSIEIAPEPLSGDGEEGKADQATYRVVVTAGPQREEFDGPCGYLTKDTLTPETLAAGVRAVHSGAGILPPDLLGTLLRTLAEVSRDVLEPRGLSLTSLTTRERNVLRLVAKGLPTREVAQQLSYSERTIKAVMHDVTTKLHAKSRSQAVALAVREGLI